MSVLGGLPVAIDCRPVVHYIGQQRLHVGRTFLDAREEHVGVGIELRGVRFGQQLTVGSDIAKRLAQVVSRHRDELFKVRVRPIQLRAECDFFFRAALRQSCPLVNPYAGQAEL